jgi:predicted phage terminase large subunit-like protein
MSIDPRLAAVELAKRDLMVYCILTMKTYRPNWHHRLLAQKLEAVERGEIDRLMITMPPRHGKSELASVRFPAWFLGRNPDKRVIGTAYSAKLAETFGRKVRDLMDDEKTRLVFDSAKLRDSSKAADRWDIVSGGGYIASGVGGAITGMGGDLILIDDPIKNQEEADSQTYRSKVWDWYQSTLYTRLEKSGAIVLTLTRWHEDDLAGRLIADMENGGERWHILNLPAVAETTEPERRIGDPLWAEKYDRRSLERIKTAVGTRVWNALYQQRPAPSEGAIFKKSWFRFYDQLPVAADRFIQSWDMTFSDSKNSDYVVGQVWAVCGADRYLVDQVRERMDFVRTVDAVRNMSAKYPMAKRKLIEDKANGPAVISMLKSEIQGIVPVSPGGSKVSRAHAVSPIIEGGNVYLPRGKRFSDELIEECAIFPNGRNDDMVDAMTQALSDGNKCRSGITIGTGGHRTSAGIFNKY